MGIVGGAFCSATVNKRRTIFISSEILSFALLIGGTTFFTADMLSPAFGLAGIVQNLTFIGQNVADKCDYQ